MNSIHIRLWHRLLAAALAAAPIAVSASPYPIAPLYIYAPPTPQAPGAFMAADGAINLSSVPLATDAATSLQQFNARAAAAIMQAANQAAPSDNAVNGEGYQSWLLANWAYPEYFNDDPGQARRVNTYNTILAHPVGQEGTDMSPFFQGDYETCLQFYIPLIYRYYNNLPPGVLNYFMNTLLTQATRSGLPTGRSAVGQTESYWSEFIHITDIVDIPETENHLIGIEVARYLINQLLYQQNPNQAYDNIRNGNSDQGAPNTTDWILHALQGYLKNDFLEYNGRPYQDYTMSALLNLATYAYDDRVRTAARMVLDYVSAKVAVSSSDLRRAPPYRRRNELAHYGPTIQGNFLGAPLLQNICCAGSSTDPYEPDPQGAFYAMLSGNTQIFFSDPPLAAGHLPGNYNWEMVHAGLCDYRVPAPLLDLFAKPSNRRFYQYFHHDAGNSEYADELYAGSPSYLISAGGRATSYCYRADIKAAAEVIVAAISIGLGGLPEAFLALLVQNAINGSSSDLGVAMPTFFMPASHGRSLSDLIQFGEYTTDTTKVHMGVAPDFACGDSIYIPPAIQNDPGKVVVGNWTFVNRAGLPGQAGYYLALYTVDNGNGGRAGFLEAYDTLLHQGPGLLSFDQFRQAVLGTEGGIVLQLGNNQVNGYTTQSGQTIQFTLVPDAQILGTTELYPAPANNGAFTAGRVLNSAQGSGLVSIANPDTGATITLDMRDAFHPVRTSETGEVDYAGEEVWVNFNYGNNSGDFAQPYRTLGTAAATLNTATPAKTIKIMSGVQHESIIINKPVQLIPVGGPVTIYAQ